MIEFPKDFLWGAATSSYQVEGNNLNSDWWEWERKAGLKEVSGFACRHYEFYKEDFDLAKGLNQNAHRLSIEWSRIEPREGEFSSKEIAHYTDVVLSLRQRNIEPIVSLHHFTNPLWFARRGGWCNKKSSYYFLRYCYHIVEALADKVNYWLTFNEPMVYIYHSYILGVWPPQERSFWKAKKVMGNLIVAHAKAHRLIHFIYKQRSLSCNSTQGKKPDSALVGIAKSLQAFIPYSSSLRNKAAVYLRNRLFNFEFLERLIYHNSLDFIGVNYYSRSLINAGGWRLKDLLLGVYEDDRKPLKKNSLGWDIYPQGLCDLLLKLKKYGLPVLITENGICTEDDNQRWDFIRAHLKNIHLAMMQGVGVRGYIYWSLMDNFEWDKGFGPRFGLIEIDYKTYKRRIRESAGKFSIVCQTGRLD